MPLPRWVARFNKRVTNRWLEPLARRSSGFAVVEHRGRSTGAIYRTPVNIFYADGRVLVALTYGPGADWYRNVYAGGGRLETKGLIRSILDVDLVGRDFAWRWLPWPVRAALRLLRVRDFALLSAGDPVTSQ